MGLPMVSRKVVDSERNVLKMSALNLPEGVKAEDIGARVTDNTDSADSSSDSGSDSDD